VPPNKCRRTQTAAGMSPAFCPPLLFPDADATRLKSPSRGLSSRRCAVQAEAPSAAPGTRPAPRRLPHAYTAPQPPRSPVGSRPPSSAGARSGERAAARWVPRGRERGEPGGTRPGGGGAPCGLAVGTRRAGQHPALLLASPAVPLAPASRAALLRPLTPLPPAHPAAPATPAPLRPPLPAGGSLGAAAPCLPAGQRAGSRYVCYGLYPLKRWPPFP